MKYFLHLFPLWTSAFSVTNPCVIFSRLSGAITVIIEGWDGPLIYTYNLGGRGEYNKRLSQGYYLQN